MSSIGDGYVRAIERAGGKPMVLPPSASPKICTEVLGYAAGLLLTGGGDVCPLYFKEQPHPRLGEVDAARDKQELALVKAGLRLGLPILGICRGLQIINIALGGAVIQHIERGQPGAIQHRQQAPGWQRHHLVDIASGTMLAEALGEGEIGVNSFHHQGVAEPAPGLTASACSSDGLVEGLESQDPWILGVQWHPERMFVQCPEFLELFKIFVAACRGAR